MSPKIPHQHPIRISFPISKVEKVRSGAREPGTNPNPNPNPNPNSKKITLKPKELKCLT